MSPSMDNFVGSLVEMAKAYEENPKLHEHIGDLKRENDEYRGTISQREESILRLKSETEQLHERIRALEVARDEAQFRTLELEELHSDILNRARMALSDHTHDLEMLVQRLDPPKPADPVPQPVAVAEPAPMKEWSGSPDPASPDTHWIKDETGERVAAEQGQGASHPTIASTDQSGSSVDAQSGTANPTANVSSPSEAPTIAEGQGASPPTSAHPSPTTTTDGETSTGSGYSPQPNPAFEPEAGPHDPEPVRYESEQHRRDGMSNNKWWDWYDRQTQEVRDAAWERTSQRG